MKTIIISLLGASTLFFSGCDNAPQGARTPSQRPAQVAMDAAKEQWHLYRAESIRHKSAGRYHESESCDRLANSAYDQYNMYYHRIQIGDFSLIPTEETIVERRVVEIDGVKYTMTKRKI
jgi:hypothetical protein